MNERTERYSKVIYLAFKFSHHLRLAQRADLRLYYIYHYDLAAVRAKLECAMALYRAIDRSAQGRSV